MQGRHSTRLLKPPAVYGGEQAVQRQLQQVMHQGEGCCGGPALCCAPCSRETSQQLNDYCTLFF